MFNCTAIYGQNGSFSAFLIYFQNVSLTMHFICCLGALQEMVYRQRRFTSVGELKTAIVTEWQKLSQRFINRAITKRPSPAGVRGPTTRSTYRTLLLNIAVTMFDIDDLLIYHPNIILTSDVYCSR